MPRKQNGETKGGGQHTSAAPTTTIASIDSRVRQLESEVRTQQERLVKRRDAADEAKFTLEQAKQEHAKTESRYLAGRIDAKLLAYAAERLEAAKKAHATATLECEETERLVSEILPQAIAEARNAALADLRDRLRTETQAKGKQLAAVLAQAKGLSDELRLLHDEAVRHFTVWEMIRLQVSLVRCLHLGEEGGYIVPAAGVPNLACPWLSGVSGSQATLYDHWRRELDAYLAKSPEQMAAADVRNRVSHIERDRMR